MGSRCALHRKLGGPQRKSGRAFWGGGGGEKIFYLSGMTTWPVGNSARSVVTVRSEKCQVSHILWTFQCVAVVQEQLIMGQWTSDCENNNLVWKLVFWSKTFLKRPWNVLPIEQDRQCSYNLTLGLVRLTIFAVEKQQVLHILSVCLVALGIQHAMRMRHIVMWPPQLYNIFPHYPISGMIFGKQVTEHKMCVLIFSTNLSETFLILRRIHRHIS